MLFLCVINSESIVQDNYVVVYGTFAVDTDSVYEYGILISKTANTTSALQVNKPDVQQYKGFSDLSGMFAVVIMDGGSDELSKGTYYSRSYLCVDGAYYYGQILYKNI